MLTLDADFVNRRDQDRRDRDSRQSLAGQSHKTDAQHSCSTVAPSIQPIAYVREHGECNSRIDRNPSLTHTDTALRLL